MKNLLILFALCLYQMAAFAQHDCGIPDDGHLIETPGRNIITSSSIPCARETVSQNTNNEFYIPNNDTPLKHIRVNVHVMQKSDGTGNFQDVPETHTFINALINGMTSDLTNIDEPLFGGPTGDPYVVDSRLRLKLTGIYFHQDDTGWNNEADVIGGGDGAMCNDYCYDNYKIDEDKALNIFLLRTKEESADFDPANPPGVGGCGPGYFGENSNYVTMIGFYDNFLEYPPGTEGAGTHGGQPWVLEPIIIHEMGHCWGLLHSWTTSQETLFPDIYIQNGNNSWCNPSEDNNCTNNFMSYSNGRGFFSRLQLGHIHQLFSGGWRTKQLCECEHDPLKTITLTANETYEWGKVFGGDLVIEPGVTLTVKCKVSMPAHGKIVVKPGAKLVVDGGILTNSCGLMWQGVEVWGDEDLSQAGNNQGRIDLRNNALIENAVVGIGLKRFDSNCNSVPGYAGGVVKATNSRFENNHVAVEFDPYVWMPGDYPYGNASQFKNCEFLTTRSLLDEAILPKAFVILNGVHKVKFFGNRFRNTAVGDPDYVSVFDELPNRGKGIQSNSSTFIANAYCTIPQEVGLPCAGDLISNEFENLEYGIQAFGEDGLDAFQVKNAEFRHNYIGIRTEGLMIGPSIIDSRFYIKPLEDNIDDLPLVGIDMEGTTGFEVEENTFEGFNAGFTQTRIGINLVNTSLSLTDNNEIYRNVFDNLDKGILVAGYNGEESEGISYGLLLKCNDFGQTAICKNDMVLYNNTSINPIQGSYELIADPAGNRFSHYCADDLLSDYFIALGSEELSYYHHSDIVTTPEDDCYSDSYLTPILVDYSYAANACPTNQSFMLTPQLWEDEMMFGGGIVKDVSKIYRGVAAKGDPNALIPFINDPTKTSIEVRNEMLRVSPYVSDAAFQAAFDRNPAMNPWQLAQVLLANAPLSGAVNNMMRTNGLDPYFNTLNRPVPDGITNERLFKMDMAKYALQASRAKNDLMRYYTLWADESLYGEIGLLLDRNNEGTDRYLRSAILLDRGDYVQADAVLGTCSGDNRCRVMKILIDAKRKDQHCPRFRADQIQALEAIANDRSSSGYTNARAILSAELGNVYPADVRIPIMPGSSPRSIEMAVTPREALFSIYPNPASQNCTIQLQELTKDEALQLVIYDTKGQLMFEQGLSAEQPSHQLSIGNLPPGLYVCQLIGETGMLGYQKLIINR